MNLRLLLTLFCFAPILGCGREQTPSPATSPEARAQYIDQSKPIAQRFMTTLKAELQQALAQGGPAGAIEVCKSVSPRLEAEFQQQHPDLAALRRVSTKTRNPQTHTPTAAEADLLRRMEAAVIEGQEPQPAALAADNQVTVLLPIRISEPTCLMCHGDPATFPQSLRDALNTHYPSDQATGYELGDFRGALALTWAAP